MSIICKKCGRQLADNAKFCGGCGARIGEAETATTPGKCPMCGSDIAPGVHFCTVCGTSIAASPAEKKDEAPVTMDELVPPVITDDMFEEPGFGSFRPSPKVEVEAVTEAYTDPIFANHNDAPAVSETIESAVPVLEAPIPEAPVTEVKVPETPVINDSFYQQPKQQPTAPTPAPVLNPAPVQQPAFRQPAPAQQQNPMNQPNFGRAPQQPYQPQGYQQPVPPIPNGYQNPNQPQYQPYPDPRTMQTKQGGGSGVIVPIILIILILGVIAFDVFYLFRDRIFGSDDDSSTNDKSSVVSTVDDEPEEDD